MVRSTNDEEGLVEILRELVGVETDAPKKRSYAIELTTRLFEKSSTKAEAVDRWRALLQEEYEESGFRSLLAHAAAESDVLLLEEIFRAWQRRPAKPPRWSMLSARIELALDDRERSRLLEQKGQVLESQENEHERAFATYLSVLRIWSGYGRGPTWPSNDCRMLWTKPDLCKSHGRCTRTHALHAPKMKWTYGCLLDSTEGQPSSRKGDSTIQKGPEPFGTLP